MAMPARSSASRVLWGAGLACLLCLLLLIGGSILLVSRVSRLVTTAGTAFTRILEQEQRWSALAQSWRPPAKDAGPDRLFPAQVGVFQRAAHNRVAVPDLGVSYRTHTTYRSNKGVIELFVYRVTVSQKDRLFLFEDETVDEAVDYKSAGTRTTLISPDRISYSLGSPRQQGTLWWNRGWLFLARTRDSADTDAFLDTYLRAVTRVSDR